MMTIWENHEKKMQRDLPWKCFQSVGWVVFGDGRFATKLSKTQFRFQKEQNDNCLIGNIKVRKWFSTISILKKLKFFWFLERERDFAT